MTGHGSYRLFHGNFIPSVPTGLPVALLTDLFNAWLKVVTEKPAASPSALVLELYHPDKWSSVPSNATAYVHRNPVRFIIIVCLLFF
jgi:hypothetical protein